MKTVGPLASVLLVAGCAAPAREADVLVDDLRYRAFGAPGWRVEIGDDIALRLGHAFFDDEVVSATYRYPRAYAKSRDGVRRWRSRNGSSMIVVEAAQGPCEQPRGTVYEDQVRVFHQGQVLTGCGGRLLSGGSAIEPRS